MAEWGDKMDHQPGFDHDDPIPMKNEDPWVTHAAQPDQLVNRIFASQNLRRPQDDPGDIVITVQDDSQLVTVEQQYLPPTVGHSIAEALANHLHRIEQG